MDSHLQNKIHYDYLIVGAGLSGAVLAERLSNILDKNALHRNIDRSINNNRIINNKIIKKYKLYNNNNNDNDNNNNINNKLIETNSDSSPEGYFNSDFNSLTEGKQTRVLLYIVIALLPCLFLVPFFMSRDFVPPIDDIM